MGLERKCFKTTEKNKYDNRFKYVGRHALTLLGFADPIELQQQQRTELTWWLLKNARLTIEHIDNRCVYGCYGGGAVWDRLSCRHWKPRFGQRANEVIDNFITFIMKLNSYLVKLLC